MFTLRSFLQAGTTKVIYAYHPDDPSSENSIPAHALESRGSRSLLLLNSLEKIPTLPNDTETFEILHDKVKEKLTNFVTSCTPGAFRFAFPEEEGVLF